MTATTWAKVKYDENKYWEKRFENRRCDIWHGSQSNRSKEKLMGKLIGIIYDLKFCVIKTWQQDISKHMSQIHYKKVKTHCWNNEYFIQRSTSCFRVSASQLCSSDAEMSYGRRPTQTAKFCVSINLFQNRAPVASRKVIFFQNSSHFPKTEFIWICALEKTVCVYIKVET